MDLRFSAEEIAFRDEVRGWLRENLAADLREKVVSGRDLGREDLLREGVPEDRMQLRRAADARYVGEAHEVQVLLEDAPLDALWDRFHDVHERTFGFGYRGEQPVEVLFDRENATALPGPPERRRIENDPVEHSFLPLRPAEILEHVRADERMAVEIQLVRGEITLAPFQVTL